MQSIFNARHGHAREIEIAVGQIVDPERHVAVDLLFENRNVVGKLVIRRAVVHAPADRQIAFEGTAEHVNDLRLVVGLQARFIVAVGAEINREARRIFIVLPMHPPRIKARSEEHTSELQSLMRNSYDVFSLKKKNMKEQKTA